MTDVKPFWVFAAGVVLLCFFLIFYAFRRPWLGPGGTQRPWLGPGGTQRPWLGPGGTRPLFGDSYHPYESFVGSTDSPSTLYMIGVDWCPHCKSAKPGFQSLGSTTTIDGHPVSFQYLDGEKDKDRLPACEVGGYPTFCFLHKGQAHRYKGPRSPEGYMNFVRKVLSGGGAA